MVSDKLEGLALQAGAVGTNCGLVLSFSAVTRHSGERGTLVFVFTHMLCPAGAIENSPALQCWDHRLSAISFVSPAGMDEI